MPERLQAIRGMNDILPDETQAWRHLETQLLNCLAHYGYQEIRFPLVENTQLFKRTLGEVTDIVEKEMYTFNDINGDSLTLRPEGTASCVRACLEHGLLHNQQQKLWYMGPMFRHERPQKGRYRQFHQLGVEAFGFATSTIELELIALSHRFWKQLGFEKEVSLQINTLGEYSERQQYKSILVDYFNAHFDKLDADSKNRLHKNPLRILDTKNPDMLPLVAKAPKLMGVLSEKSLAHFQSLCKGLEDLNIPFTINPTLVRGLDYYGHTVFEWVTTHLGSQATICAGGRYDGLVEQLGGNPAPAVGFALGIERLLLLMQTLNVKTPEEKKPALFLMASNDAGVIKALTIAESLRDAFPHLLVMTNTACGSFKSQFKKADKSGADLALILGEEELQHNTVSVKDLRKASEQLVVDLNQLNQFLQDYLART